MKEKYEIRSKDFQFIQFNQLDEFMLRNQVTPWFHLIYQSGLLSQWWSQLMQSDLESVSVDPSIRLLQYPPK